jgi:dienelactone hydrolase
VTRRTALALAIGYINGRADVRYRQYPRCFPDYLSRLAREAYNRRNTAIAKLTNPATIKERQRWVRETFWKLTGGVPERSNLNVRTIGAFDRKAYRVEKLLYESQPGFHVPANLYIPKDRQPPFPGVLFQMGHSLNGKAADSYQKCCQSLAQLGYLVLAFDPMGQGERTYYPRPNGVLTRLGSADDEHSQPGKQMLLVGDTATRMQAWDAVRSLDVLASHPLVDPKRLASTGQSGGGTLTMLLTAVDERLAAAAVSSGNTENFASEDFNSPGSVDDAEQNFIDAGPVGFDRWDLLYPMAPKPMLISVSGRDFFGTYSPSYLTNGRPEFDRLKNVYRLLGKEKSLEWFETPLPHALSRDMRLQIYNFFERTLRNSEKPVTEPDVKPETDAQLYVGATGNVVRDFGSKTPLSLARERLPLKKTGTPMKALLRVDTPPPNTSFNAVGRAQGEVNFIDAVEVQVSREVWLPGFIFLPEGKARSVIVPLEPRGRNARWKEGDLYPQLAAAGYLVAAFDIRGIGDLSPEVGRGNSFYAKSHAEEEAYAWASLMLGKPLLGQRVTDILHIVGALRNYPPARGAKVTIAALDQLTVPALLAGEMDEAIDVVYTARGLESYASLLNGEHYAEPFANFVPKILSSGDLPEVRNRLGARLKQGKAWDFDTLSSL